MRFSILTLFPDIIKSYISSSIINRAIQDKKISVDIIDIRDFTQLKHNQVDDTSYGGGRGMVLMPGPVVEAIESVKTKDSLVMLTSPQGITWNQEYAKTYTKKYDHLIIICGHYEGFDERILDYVDVEVSIGDYVMTGGELASLVIMDSISRLVPGVIQKESHEQDSFENGLLDYPAYTKPYNWRDKTVPDVLLSGHHENIQKYREKTSLLNTLKKRPDLIEKAKLTPYQQEILKDLKSKGEK